MKTVTTSVGFQDPLGNLVLSGNLVLTLSQAAEVTSGGGLIAPKVVVLALSATTAKIASTQIYFSDELTPSGTTYHAELLDSGGNIIADFGQWSITGASADLSTMVPVTTSTISAPGIVLLNPSTGVTQTVTQTTGTNLQVNRFENIRFADQFAVGSTTGGIQEAINDLPAGGGIVWLPAGTTTCTSGITIQKPVRLIGHGCGGATDAGTDAVYVAGTTLVNNTTGTNLLTISLAGGATSLVGVTLENFAIQGNKSFAGATTGDCITITSGNASTQIVHTMLQNLTLHDAKSNGISIKENVYGLNIEDCWISKCAGHGIAVSSSGTGIPSQIRLARVFDWLHTGDALNISTTNAHDVSAVQCTFANSTNGVKLVTGATAASFRANDGTSFESNSNAGILVNDGFIVVENCNFPGDSVQLYGIRVDPSAGASATVVQAYLSSNVYSGHVTKDVSFSANTKLAFMGPDIQGTTVNFEDLSGKVIGLISQAAFMRVIGSFVPNANASQNLGDPALAWGSFYYVYGGLVEGVAPSGAAGRTLMWADSTSHEATVNSNNTGSAQIVSVKGKTSQKSETAADTNVLTFTPPALAGTYRINFALSLSAANTATLGWTATWTDSNGNAQAPTNLSLFQEGTAAPALTFATSAAGNYYGTAIIDINNAAVNIVVKLTFTGTSFTGKASATVERLI